jgi:hypothetical protein
MVTTRPALGNEAGLSWFSPFRDSVNATVHLACPSPSGAGIHDTVGLFIVMQSFPPVIPAKAGTHLDVNQCRLIGWIPATAGMTGE